MCIRDSTIAAIHANKLYSPYIYCHRKNAVTSWTADTSIDLKKDDVVTVYVGFITPPLPWWQVTGGGNTYANELYSKMPILNNPDLLFDKTAAPLEPGILSVKTKGEISDQEFVLGMNNISSKNWSTNNGMMDKDWYAFYTARLAQATQLPYTDGGSKPTWTGESTYKVYTTKGTDFPNLTISAPWRITPGEKIMVDPFVRTIKKVVLRELFLS